MAYALDADAVMSLFAMDDEQEGKKPKKDKAEGPVPYVMVSDGNIPPFNDRVKASAWDLKQFKYRGGILLYDHNFEMSRPPIGSMANVKKGVEVKRSGRTFKAVTGDANFADREVYAFAGMIEDLVRSGSLRGGSIGFDILAARAPSEKEQEELGMKPYSTMIEKASPFEFSITPIGRDENAQRLSADAFDPLEAKLAEFAKEGIYPDECIGTLREDLREKIGQATKVGIVVPEEYRGVPLPAETVAEPVLPSLTISSEPQTPMLGVSAGEWNAPVDAALAKRDEAIEELKAQVATLTKRLDEGVYDLIFRDDDVAEPSTPTEQDNGATDGGSGDPLFDSAVSLGF